MTRTFAIVEPYADTGEHSPLLMYAGSDPVLCVQATQDARGYELTSVYADGTRGVNSDDLIEAEIDDSPACACCSTPVSRWTHSS